VSDGIVRTGKYYRENNEFAEFIIPHQNSTQLMFEEIHMPDEAPMIASLASQVVLAFVGVLACCLTALVIVLLADY
jgi:hypothetical protein